MLGDHTHQQLHCILNVLLEQLQNIHLLKYMHLLTIHYGITNISYKLDIVFTLSPIIIADIFTAHRSVTMSSTAPNMVPWLNLRAAHPSNASRKPLRR